MKKIFLAIIFISLIGQYSCIIDQDKYKETEIFEEFETQKGFLILHLPPVLFKVVMSLSDEDRIEAKEILDKIDLIKVLFFQESENTNLTVTELKSKIHENIKGYEYNLLTRIAEKDTDISIYIIDKEDVIHEVLVLMESDDEYVGFNLVGKLTKEEVFKVYKMINTENIQNIEN